MSNFICKKQIKETTINQTSIQVTINESTITKIKFTRCKASKVKPNINPLYQTLCGKLNCIEHYCYICGNKDSDHTFYDCPLKNK